LDLWKLTGMMIDCDSYPQSSWRLWFKERTKGSTGDRESMSELEKFDIDLDSTFKEAQVRTERMVGDMFGDVSSKFQEEEERTVAAGKLERTQKLVELSQKFNMSQEMLDGFLNWIHLDLLPSITDQHEIVPKSYEEAQSIMERHQVPIRKTCMAFSHSLERNGANNFLLYLVRELKDVLAFEVVSPKDGPMKEDYLAMGVPVRFADMKSPTYEKEVRSLIDGFDFSIANTIMTTEVIIASKEMGVHSLWVIHEAWPKDQMNYYAKEVFLMPHLDQDKIFKAFAEASQIVFPAKVQQACYEGLFDPENARVIYNGIPLASINTFRAVQSRIAVRKDLGYGPDDLLILHIGTVCKRKAQLVTAKAFSKLVTEQDFGEKTPKLLMVGARYIRQHEIDYINEVKQELERSGGIKHTTILDVRKNVLPFYLAADVIVCPSINEVLPLVICEAMAFERPVVASRIDGIPEALTDNQEGFLVPPGDPDALYQKLAALLHDDRLREEMGKRGRERVLSQFSFSIMSRHYRETLFKNTPNYPPKAIEA